jgi:hypothetical protein
VSAEGANKRMKATAGARPGQLPEGRPSGFDLPR